MRYIKLCFLLLFFFSCSRSVPELSESDMQFAEVLTDVYLVNGLANQLPRGNKDSTRTQLMIQVLAQHEMDTTKFYKNLYQYEKDPLRMKMIFDTVVYRLEKLKK